MNECSALTWDSPCVEAVIYTLGDSFDSIRETLIKGNHPYRNRKFASGKTTIFCTKSKLLGELSQESISEVAKFFRIPDLNGKEYNVLMLTSSFFMHSGKFTRNLDLPFDEEYAMPFRLLIDQVYGDSHDLIVKAHPNDEINNLTEDIYFPESVYIPGYVPSELLPYCNCTFKLGSSPGSNSILTFDIGRIVTLPRSYFNNIDLFMMLPLLNDLADRLSVESIMFCNNKDSALIDSFSSIIGKCCTTSVPESDSIRYYLDYNSYMKDKKKRPQDISVVNLNGMEIVPPIFNKYLTFDIKRCNPSSVHLPEHGIIGISLPNSVGTSLDNYCLYRHFNCSDVDLVSYPTPYYELVSEKKFRISKDKLPTDDILSVIESCGENPDSKEALEYCADILGATVYSSEIPNKYRRSYFSLLWKKQPHKTIEIKHVLNYMFYMNDDYAYRYAGWIYNHGLGVKKDRDKAATLLREAHNRGIPRATFELCNLLIEIKTETSLKECASIILNSKYDDDPRAKVIKDKLNSARDS